MVGGIEKWGDGVEIKVDIPADGTYNFDVVYGKHNDSGVPQGRDFAVANVELDGNMKQIKLLANMGGRETAIEVESSLVKKL